tara:strand:+ start:7740 stop:8387 length:648 start_codon:yes stop_codon:yes gene_type:complete
MSYFRQLPNIEYQNFLTSSTGSQDYLLLKNIFLRGKLRDDLQSNFTVFQKYNIRGDERPDQIAYNVYGASEYDWVVLVTANIINYQNDYPITVQQLYDYVIDKYGTAANNINHYVSTEVRDSSGRLIYPAGVVVAPNFTIQNPDNPFQTISPIVGITNFEYETNKNDKKREIFILRPSYLNQFLNDMRDISKYGFNSEYVNADTIRAANTKNTSP